MIKVIKSWFGFSKLDDDVVSYLDRINARTGFAVSLVIIILEVIVFALSFTPSLVQLGEINGGHWLLFHRIAYIAMILAYLQLFLFSYFLTRWHVKHVVLNLSICIMMVVSILFSNYVSILDYELGEQILVFVSIAILVSVAFFIKPYIAFLLLVFDFALFYIAMSKSAVGISVATKVNYPVLFILLVVVNLVRYRHFVRVAESSVKNEKLTSKLRYISMYDTLTQAKNRYALREDFKGLLNKPLLLMLSDIDDFKKFNDSLGHEKGDQILKSFSALLKNVFGENNCYRYGGDEFLIIIPYADEKEFLKGIETCSKADKEFNFSGGYVTGTPVESDDFRNLIAQADERLYKAKQKGKNCVVGE